LNQFEHLKEFPPMIFPEGVTAEDVRECAGSAGFLHPPKSYRMYTSSITPLPTGV
jgi:hypothetical protein